MVPMLVRLPVAIVVLSFAGELCWSQTQNGSPNESLYDQRLVSVLKTNCAGCHSQANPSGGLNLATYESALAGGKHGPSLTPGNAVKSLLVQYLRGEQSPKMPLGGSLDEPAIAAIAAAIDQMKPLSATAKKKDPYLDWLLKKPAAPAIPTVADSAWVKNPIDAFILAKLEAKGLKPALAASKRTLIRRTTFDLIGLPPTPEEVAEFEKDTSPDAYEKVLDRLLADPRYGERWARHWLDLARFAESDGFAIDGERPTAWRYRDYVIRSLNKDKPYDVFVKEQIAGDEMGGDDRSEKVVALGFLRMGTWEADANFKTQLRQDVLNELTGTVGQVFLGFTVGCARCHDHKYDPIPQRDFYRLQSFFAPMRVEDRPAPFLEAENPKQMKELMRRYEDESEESAEALKAIEAQMKEKYCARKNIKADDKKAGDFLGALRNQRDETFSAEERKQWRTAFDLARKLRESAARYRPVAYAVSDVAPPHVPELASTYVLAGGELANRGEKVEPGFLQAVTGNGDPAKIPFAGGSSGRRTALAEWIASPDNPLTARVMVNRLWLHHFGEGIVRTPSDFGLNGDRPTHPELLDYLATQFSEKKWSLKAMHKLMLLSSTYRQSTEHPEFKRVSEADPKNTLYWRMNWQRLEGETIRDSILAVSGQLRGGSSGPGVFVSVPADVAEGFEFFKWFPSDDAEQARRTIYTFQRRSVMNPMVEVFDGANMSEVCSRRSSTVVPTQAFSLLNSEFTNTQAANFAKYVVEHAGSDPAKSMDAAFLRALGRLPSAKERDRYLSLATGNSPVESLTQLGVVLFNLNEFLYLD